MMALVIEFDVDGIESIQKIIRKGIRGYSTDSLVPKGISTIWLFLAHDVILKICSTMTDTSGWNEVGKLVFRPIRSDVDIPKMQSLIPTWLDVKLLEKLVVDGEGFSAESGLRITNSSGEIFTIVCSENVYQLEISAPFFEGGFSPEYEMSHYKSVPMQE